MYSVLLYRSEISLVKRYCCSHCFVNNSKMMDCSFGQARREWLMTWDLTCRVCSSVTKKFCVTEKNIWASRHFNVAQMARFLFFVVRNMWNAVCFTCARFVPGSWWQEAIGVDGHETRTPWLCRRIHWRLQRCKFFKNHSGQWFIAVKFLYMIPSIGNYRTVS